MLIDSSMPNLLHEYLKAVGIPWELSRASLAAKYGIKPHPAYSWDVIEIATQPPFIDGLLWPMSAQVFSNLSPHMPATYFSGVVYHCDDARENLALSVNNLKSVLGEGKATGCSNSIGHKWVFGPASVDLLVLPPDLQWSRTSNPSQEREPRLKSGCYVELQTGFRQKASADEMALFERFVPIARILQEPSPTRQANIRPASQSELEYVRQPDVHFDHCHGWVGTSFERSALIWFSSELYVVPMDEVIEFQVTRTLPAKGGGGSWLTVECRCNYPGHAKKSLVVRSASGPDELNEFARTVANATSKPLVLLPYDYDV